MLGISVAIILGAVSTLLVLALDVLMCVWVYRDAQHKGMNGILWTAVAFLVPSCIGLIVYLIVRSDHNKVTCSNCRKFVNGREKFCSNCGMELEPLIRDDAEFKKSQRHTLIAFFSCCAASVICGVMMAACMIVGSVNLVGDAVQWVSERDWSWTEDFEQWEQDLEETLGSLDILFDEEEIKVSATEEEVLITGKDGKQLLRVDGENGSVELDISAWSELCDKYGVEYNDDISEEELKRKLEEALEYQWENEESAQGQTEDAKEQQQIEEQVKKSVENAIEDALGVDIIEE